MIDCLVERGRQGAKRMQWPAAKIGGSSRQEDIYDVKEFVWKKQEIIATMNSNKNGPSRFYV